MRQNMIASTRQYTPMYNYNFDPSDLISNSALHNGTATIFSSDHCPFRYDHPHGKPSGVLDHPESMEGESDTCRDEALQDLLQRKQGSFRHIPNGIPGVETRLHFCTLVDWLVDGSHLRSLWSLLPLILQSS